MWVIQCLGLFGLLTVLSAVAVFIGACVVVFKSRRPAVIASYMAFLLLPLLFGIIGALNAIISTFDVLAMTDVRIDVRQSQVLGFMAEVSLFPLIALISTLPSYFVLSIGLFVRTIFAGTRPRDGEL
jgi:hypothetical protein